MLNIKSIFVYKIENKFFFRADSQTTKGMYKADGPYFIINEILDFQKLGEQILKTFNECKVGLPHPEDLTKLNVLKKADPYSTSEESKLLNKLQKTYKNLQLSIVLKNNSYIFRPQRVVNKNASEGIDCDPLISDGNPENLGKTLLQAFELCK